MGCWRERHSWHWLHVLSKVTWDGVKQQRVWRIQLTFFREQCDGLSMFDDGLLSGSTGARQSTHSGTISGVLRSDWSGSSPSLGSWPHEVAPDLASAKSVRPDRSSCVGTPCEEWSIHLTVYYMHKSCATSGRDSLSVGVPVIEHTPKAHLGEPSS